jgi:hypothetical protein
VATSDPADFLGRCHPAIRAIYEYWDGKRGGRRLPARSDIDPTEFVPHLPGIMLVDVVADERRYVYRLVGTREVEARGQNPTGKPVGEKFHGSSRENVLRNYDRVCRERAALFDDYHFTSPGGRLLDEQVIFLPLSADGEAVSQILVYTHHRRLP